MLLMPTHLDEAVYEAGVLDRPCVITIGETGSAQCPDRARQDRTQSAGPAGHHSDTAASVVSESFRCCDAQ